MFRYLALVPFFALTLACSSGKSTAPAAAPNLQLEALKTTMTGSFSSSLQASVNDSYYNIVLNVEPIWPGRSGHYLYVEQALASDPNQPYRQRVYELEKKGRRGFVSRVYELPEPKRFVGAYKAPERLDVISPADLVLKEGCAVYLKLDESGIYRGSTKKKKCASSLDGAEYATSRVSISQDFMQSWDRGFNGADEQVWGATEGGYMFFRK